MGGVNIPLVALQLRAQQQQDDPMAAYGRMQELQQRLAMGQQQMQLGQQQLQGGALDIQAKQRALADQQTMQQTLAKNNGDIEKSLPELAGKITPGAYKDLATFHVDTKFKLSQIGDNELKIQQDAHDRTAQLLKQASDLSDLEYQQQWPAIAKANNDINPGHQLDPSNPIPKSQLPGIGIGLQTQEQYLKQEAERREQETAVTTQQKNKAEAGKLTAEMPGGGLYAPSDNALYGQAVNPATATTPQGKLAAAMLQRKQAEKLQLTGAEASARIAAENSPAAIAGAVNKKQALDAATGAGEQVYATDHQGRTVLMAKGDAINAGYGYTKVGSHQVSEDRQLNNRLADVRQKIAQYEQSFQQPLDSHGWFSSSDRSLIAQVIGTDKFKAGVFGAEIPVDWMNKLGRSSLYANMSPQAQQRVISYFNAREAIQGYQRVLTGSGRSSEKAMELNLDTLPAPIDPEGFAGNALKAFKQNVVVAGQGMPILPGVKTPEQIEQQVNTR